MCLCCITVVAVVSIGLVSVPAVSSAVVNHTTMPSCGDKDMNACAATCNRRKEKETKQQKQLAASSDSTSPRSFYQRKLPETCVAFASSEGKKIFRSSLVHNGLKCFYNLIEQHHTQTEPAFCGVSTLVLVLNALAVDPGQNWKGPWRWYEEKMLNCCVDLEEIKQTGITMQDFQCLAFCQGLSVDLNYCDETSSLEEFRKAVEQVCLEEPPNGKDDPSSARSDGPKILECLVVSYSRKVLNQTGDGHFSPLAAYDKLSDSVLILDTARFKYGAHWTKLPLIYEAMKPVDSTTGKSRGYALLSFVPEPTPQSNGIDTTFDTQTIKSPSAVDAASSTSLINTSKLSTQPTSILYRSMMNQKRKRRRYKEHIQSLREKNDQNRNEDEDIPYEVVRSYWCEGKERPSCVWEIIVPTRVRTEEEKELLREMRILLASLQHATVGKCSNTVVNGDPIKEIDSIVHNETNNDNNTDGVKEIDGCQTCDTYNPTTNHTVSVSADETLYIIYLATMLEKRRYDFVMNFESPATPDVVRKQIIKEADMIASAIEVSDQLTSL